MKSKPKFKAGDIVVGKQTNYSWRNEPSVILGLHTFPNGIPAYRMRACHPQIDMDDGSEIWVNKDFYMEVAYVNKFNLLWRENE